MKNPATCTPPKEQFNIFTLTLFNQCKSGVKPKVLLRNGILAEIEWFDDDGPEYEHFLFSNGRYYLVWYNDGTSVTSSEFDMMETVTLT